MKSFPPVTASQTLIVRHYSSFDIDVKSVLQNTDLTQVYIALAHSIIYLRTNYSPAILKLYKCFGFSVFSCPRYITMVLEGIKLVHLGLKRETLALVLKAFQQMVCSSTIENYFSSFFFPRNLNCS